jgi:ribose transport system permease protein
LNGIAIAAVGMTLVILTAGIDLSVGSVLALSGCAGSVVGFKLDELGIGGSSVAIGLSTSFTEKHGSKAPSF